MTNSLKEEISLTITTIDTLIVNLKNNIRIDSKRIFIVKKITKKYIESLNFYSSFTHITKHSRRYIPRLVTLAYLVTVFL